MRKLKERLLAKRDLRRKAVELTEIGETVHIRKLTGKERDTYEFEVMKRRTPDGGMNDIRGMRAMLVCMALVDEDGSQVFPATEAEQLNSTMDADAIDLLFDEVKRFNGMTEAAVEDARKNSAATPGVGST